MNPKIAVAQLDCKLGDVHANLLRMTKLASSINRKETDLVCFPELVTTGYSLGERWARLAEPIPGPTTEHLSRIASEFGFYLIAGIAERDLNADRIYNSAVLIDDEGEIIGVYRKVHLWGEERRHFTPGSSFSVFRTKIGRVGIGICYDLEFPESARTLAMNGAEIVFFPSAEMTPFEKHVDAFVPSRAAENGIFVAFSNRVGREGQTVFFGHSQIASPSCRLLARSSSREGFCEARLEMANIAKERKRVPYLQQRVPTAYANLIATT